MSHNMVKGKDRRVLCKAFKAEFLWCLSFPSCLTMNNVGSKKQQVLFMLEDISPRRFKILYAYNQNKNDTWKFALISYFLDNCKHPYVVSWLYQCYKGQKNSKAKGPSQVSNVEKWKSSAFWTNFVHRMSPCSRFHTHIHTLLYILSRSLT